jgi:hypothetical protein
MIETAKAILARLWTAYGAYLWLASTSLFLVLFLASCARVFNVSQPSARSRSSGNQQKVSEADRNMDISAICASVKRVCAEKGL